MPDAIVRITALFLLLAQAWSGIARGEVLCIRLGNCGHHDSPSTCHHVEGEHEHVHSHAEVNIRCEDLAAFEHHHEHGPLAAIELQHPSCGCHIHVPASGDRPAAPLKRAPVPQPRDLFVPRVIAILTWNRVPLPSPGWWMVHDQQPTAESRTLLTTRLLL